MEICPSDFRSIELTRNEKMFVRYAASCGIYGLTLLSINPTMTKDESMHVVVCSKGIVFFQFLENIGMPDFGNAIKIYSQFFYPDKAKILAGRLKSNKSLVNSEGLLKFPVNFVYIIPEVTRMEALSCTDSEIQPFVDAHCLLKDDFSSLRSGFEDIINSFLTFSITEVNATRMEITDNNINGIIQRFAPEYTTVRVAHLEDENTSAGADKSLLVIDQNDTVVRAFRLDQEQINIVNRISRDDPNQLILACAGSGKSVLLIAKCFKAAQMNPDKKFLITCFNRNLRNLYIWFIDRAGLREKNVECATVHELARNLMIKNNIRTDGIDIEYMVDYAIQWYNKGKIADKYYGIFIDEVQVFHSEWYKFCYNLLEHKGVLFRLDEKKIIKWLRKNDIISDNEMPDINSDEDVKLWYLNNIRPSLIRPFSPIDESHGFITSYVYRLIHSISHLLIKAAADIGGLGKDSMSEYLFPGIPAILIYCQNSQGMNLGSLYNTFEAYFDKWLYKAYKNAQKCVFEHY